MIVQFQCQPQADRRAIGEQQQLLELAPDALGGQVVERNAARQFRCARVERELKTRRELNGAQHAQAVFAEGRVIDRTQDTRRQVRAAAEGIFVDVSQRVEGDGVDGEIAPAGGLADCQVRIASYGESAMTG